MSSILRIKSLMNEFTPSERKLADYILENAREIYTLSAVELANSAGTSAASVVRFSKKLGYAGFQDLKISIAKDMVQKDFINKKIYEGIEVSDTTKQIIDKIANENIKAINDTISLLDERSINQAVEAIANSNYIYIYGVGASALVAMDLQYKLVRINKPVSMYIDSHTQLVSAANLSDMDLAIGISHSGTTIEVYKSLEMAKKKGAKTISITKFGNNPISDLVDISIYTTGVEGNLRAGAIASRIAQLTIIDILYIELVKMDFKRITEKLKESRAMVEEFKIQK